MLARRLLVTFFFAIWFGGFTLYVVVAIPSAFRAIGNHRDVGFITRQVTNGLNVIGVISLSLLMWDRRRNGRLELEPSNDETRWQRIRSGEIRCWLILMICQGMLLGLHVVLDSKLDPAAHEILDTDHFYSWHRVYLWTSTVWWVTAICQWCYLLATWHSIDRRLPRLEV